MKSSTLFLAVLCLISFNFVQLQTACATDRPFPRPPPDEEDTLQEVIDSCEDGDVVVIEKGTEISELVVIDNDITIINSALVANPPVDPFATANKVTFTPVAEDIAGPAVAFVADASGSTIEGIFFTNWNVTALQVTSADVTIRNCRISNTEGEAIVLENASGSMVNWVIANCEIDGDSSSGVNSRGIRATGEPDVVPPSTPPVFNDYTLEVQDCLFGPDLNDSFAAGIWLDSTGASSATSATITNCVFDDCISESLFCGSFMVSVNCLFENCVFRNSGGAVSLVGGGGCVIEESTRFDLASVEFTKCIFEDNIAGQGGGLVVSVTGLGDAVFDRCVFTGNVANADVEDHPEFTRGGAILDNSGTDAGIFVYRCTLVDNIATTTGAAVAVGVTADATVEMRNCILWDTGSAELLSDDAGEFDITYSDVKGGYAGTGNINSDPLFVPTPPVPPLLEFMLTNASPCIDAGKSDDPHDDWDTNPEMGAFSARPDSFRRGDADGNGIINALLDSLYYLRYAYADDTDPPCLDAADADNSGEFGLLDGLRLLRWQFSGGAAPPDPFTTCGPDTGTSLGCDVAFPCGVW